jgi:hypothetical protein
MKRFFVACVLASLTGSAAAQAGADPLAPFGWLRQLAGSCWRGEYGNTRTSDTQCYAWQYDRFLRGTIELTGAQGAGGGAGELRGDSVWAWDATRKRLLLTTWANNGTLASGEAVFDGDLLRVTMQRGDAPATFRTTWQRLDADAYLVRRERREGDAWREVLVVRYARVK